MQAALDLAKMGLEVDLVEKKPRLGGRLADLNRVYPSMQPAQEIVSRIGRELLNRKSARIHLETEVVSVIGVAGDFSVELLSRKGTEKEKCLSLTVGGIILATGLEPIDPSIIPEFGYGRWKDVITSLEFEGMLANAERTREPLSRPSDGQVTKSIAFVQCVGSRVEKRGVPYCSSVCCMGAIKNSILVKERFPETQLWVLYIDIRAQGKGHEDLYKKARQFGVKFVRGQPSMVMKRSDSDKILVCGENTLLRELYEIPVDLVVLSVGLRQPADNVRLLRMLGVAQTPDGLAVEKDICVAPGESSVTGVFLAGMIDSPKDICASIAQGGAAAAKMKALANEIDLRK
jgi:heterodisulfide reductase subunit A-like polyferredoxin